MGERYNAPVNFRFDDTNPAKEEQQFVDAIKENIQWLGYQWDRNVMLQIILIKLYQWAKNLIAEGKAYVDSQSSEEHCNQKGTPTKPGKNSPYRNRSIEENRRFFPNESG